MVCLLIQESLPKTCEHVDTSFEEETSVCTSTGNWL